MDVHFNPKRRLRRLRNKYLRSFKCRQLEVGMQGIIFSFPSGGGKCKSEVYSLLNEYADRLYGAEKQLNEEDKPTGSEEQEEEDDDYEGETAQTALERKDQSPRRFQALSCRISNFLFVRSINVEPEKLVHYILKDLSTTKQKKELSLQCMIPISGSCRATPEDIRKYAEVFLQPWFAAPNKGNYRIMLKVRKNYELTEEIVVPDLIAIVCRLNKENKFDMKETDYTIVVEIIESICCLGVVKDYELFEKYNLQEVIKSVEWK